MKGFQIIFGFLSISLLPNSFSELSSSVHGDYSFPDNFSFGVASSAYQVEGGAHEDGKIDSIWDFNLRQKPEWVDDKSNGDVASDSYHKWRRDIQLIKDLKADFYRFSIAWTRILPQGNKNSEVNEKGVEYYSNLIDGLLAKGIIPMVTMYHFDLPQCLQANGGWMNGSIVEDFVYYSKILFEKFGDRVKHWITFNEPYQICESGYSEIELAPFLNKSGIGGYICGHNLLIAHGRTYREYDTNFRKLQNGKVAITINSQWFEPKSDSDSDKEAAERMIQFWYGWYMHPVVQGNYPPIMIQRIDQLSKQEGFNKSRLPKFTEEQIEMIRGSFDFLGLNHYSTELTTFDDNFSQPSIQYDCGVRRSADPKWEVSFFTSILKKVPWGFRKLLVWIKKEYGNPPIFVTENGWSTTKGLNDADRISHLNEYLSELLKAIHEDGCNVIGYTYWSLMDSFEWTTGYIPKFGLVEVDFDSPERTRTPRRSYGVYQKIITSRKIS